MAKLTPALAIKHLAYIEREEANGRLTENLRSIREHRQAFLLRSKCCFACGERIENKESLRLWAQDRLGPVCRQKLETAVA